MSISFVRPAVIPDGYLALEPLILKRIQAGVSQATLAAAAGWWPTRVNSLERGRVPRVTHQDCISYRDALMVAIAAKNRAATQHDAG